MSEASRTIHGYVFFATILGASVGWLALHFDQGFSLANLIGFGLLIFVTAQFPLTLSTGALYDISFVVTFAAIVAAGPATATLATVLATLSISQMQNRSAERHIFNAAQLVVSAGLSGLVYMWLDGPIGATWQGAGNAVPELIPPALLALAAATVVNFLVNTSLVSGAIALSSGRSFASVWRGYPAFARNYVAFAALGLLLGILQVRIGWASAVFLLTPLLVARHAFQASVTMQGIYDDTLRALMHAIETKDPYTRGHAERVSRLAEMTARTYGLGEDQCRLIRYAALMHDVGKLGVLSAILQKPGKLTPDEYDHMKLHPARGVEIVGEIDLLEEAIVGVRHHHERMDGKGYPDGLKGEEIPLLARLITVSDAFDSMTSTRTYRVAKSIEEAFAELRRCAGTQFDPRCLDALEKAIAKYGWEPFPEAEQHKQIDVQESEHAVSL